MSSWLPTPYEDPFLKYRPFPKELSTNHYANHWHEILFMVVFYFTIQKISPYISKKYFGSHYTSLSKRTQIDFDIHVVSMVQCVVSLGSILPMWNNQFSLNRVNDTVGSVYGYYPYGGLVASLAIAYFIWDTYVCLRHFSSFGFGFLFHGVAALFVFGSTLQPFCMSWVPSFLLFEASTPFVNVNWFSSRLPGIVPEKIVVVNGILLLISFFSVRILWGFYAMSLVATDLYRTWGMNHWVFPVGLVVINLSLDALNVYWFYKMLRIAAKKIRGTKSPKSLAKEAAEKID